MLLASDLAGARSQSMFAQSMERIAEAFGFEHFMIFNAPANGDTILSPLVIETSMPMHFIKDFDRIKLLAACRLLTPSRESVLPITWQLHLEQSSDIDFPDILRTYLMDRDLNTGFVFSVYSAEGQRLVFWFSGKRSGLAQNEINELCMIVLQALASYNTIKRNSAALTSTLSAREIEVVRWTAQGKTSLEIGQILAISDHTVNAYMTNAIRKLNCVNRTQLVAKAIRMRLIH